MSELELPMSNLNVGNGESMEQGALREVSGSVARIVGCCLAILEGVRHGFVVYGRGCFIGIVMADTLHDE